MWGQSPETNHPENPPARKPPNPRTRRSNVDADIEYVGDGDDDINAYIHTYVHFPTTNVTTSTFLPGLPGLSPRRWLRSPHPFLILRLLLPPALRPRLLLRPALKSEYATPRITQSQY